jgi:hypothetical protein
MTRVCGSNETAAGHGCTNLVSDNGDHCAAGYKSVPPNPNCEHEDKTSCFCESVLTGKPWSPETEELATPPHAQQRIRVEWYQVQEAKFDDAELYNLGSMASVHCGYEMIENEGETN